MTGDTNRIQQLLAAADPAPSAAELAEDVRLVRQRVASSRPARWRQLGGVAAALVALLVGGVMTPFALPSSAWASETTTAGDTLVVIDLPEFYRRGHDPGPLVAELGRHGIEVEVEEMIDLTPWKHGRIVGISFGISMGTPEIPLFFQGESSPEARQELFDSHGILPDDGRYTIAAERFDGTLTIRIGRFPGTGAVPDA